METLIVAILLTWLVKAMFERARGEYRHVRDQHAKTVRAEHPQWSERRVRARAARHAGAYWAEEIRGGFPTMRAAFREDRAAGRLAREQDRDAHETRMEDLSARLESIRKARTDREEYVRANSGPDATPGERARLRREWADATPEQRARWLHWRPSAPDAPSRKPDLSARTRDGGTGAEDTSQPPPPPPPDPPDPPDPNPDPLADSGKPSGTDPEKPPADASQAPPPVSTTEDPDADADGTENPGHPAGDTDDTDEGDTEMTADAADLSGGDSPYDAAQAVIATVAAEASKMAVLFAEDLPAGMAVHGFTRDTQLNTDMAELEDLANQLAAKAANARTGFASRHAEGAEYHDGGQGAERSGFVNA